MARILTGIQSSGRPHLGNILGAIQPGIDLSKTPENESFFFIADLHSLTSIKDPKVREENVNAVAAAWLALGFDTEKNTFYRQSRVAEVTELAWYLNCFMPYSRMQLAHSFKDKSDALGGENDESVNTGLFAYPMLMAADILLYDANLVPVGKDQQQHLEFTRFVAKKINHHYQEEIFVIPQAKIDQALMTVPGTDGRKMSKSYNNYIDVFLAKKPLKKQVMSIVTDTTPLADPKDPDTCNVFALYSLLADDTQIAEMRKKYQGGNYGYGHAKNELLGLMLDKYADAREKFDYYMNNLPELHKRLEEGEAKARGIATPVLNKVRKAMGYL
ncbi:tryptophan--tRNA ligase [marine bacterium AO1-C]|nr:tryptophan--tRNA ligase [marine bacterium AO1-C]